MQVLAKAASANDCNLKNDIFKNKLNQIKKFKQYTYGAGTLVEAIPVIFIDKSENRFAGTALVTVVSVVACNKFLITVASWELAIYSLFVFKFKNNLLWN